MTKPSVAFFGLGYMGSGMAARLLGAGFPVTVYNRTADKAKPLVAAGAKVAASPRAAAENADFIISVVADDVASRAVWLGDSGALAGIKSGTIVIEISTLTVEWVIELSALIQAKGCEFIDAPVTGSRIPAAKGELHFFVGGEMVTLDKCREVLAPMGNKISYIGPVGSGARIKLIHNFMAGVQVASFAEALAMLDRSGLDREKALPILTDCGPGSPLVKSMAQRMTAPDYTPNFMLRLMSKDLGYAVDDAEKISLDLAMGKAAYQVFKNSIAAGDGDLDMSAIVKVLRPKN